MSSEEQQESLEAEVVRLRAALDAERRHAEQWRQVAEERRVALERLRQHTVVRLVLKIAGIVLPPVRRTRLRLLPAVRRTRSLARRVRSAPQQLGAGKRERDLRASLAASPPPPSDPRRVSIVIPTHNAIDRLARLLPALRRTQHEAVEILIIDNASNAETASFLSAQSDVRTLRSETNLSFSAANNLAAKASFGEVLCFLNDDVEPVGEDWLPRMLEALQGGTVAVGAQLVYPRRPLLAARTRDLGVQHRGIEFRPKAVGVPHAVNLGEGTDPIVDGGPSEVAAVTAACMVVERNAFEAVGGFDEGYVYGAEDVDLCWRLRRAGGRIAVVPDAVLFHHEGATRHLEDPARLHVRQQRNWDRLAHRFGPELSRAVDRDRVTAMRKLTRCPYRIAITVTRDREDAGYGDWYTAHELGAELVALGWHVSYVERYRDAWYDLPNDVDVLLVLLDTCDLRRLARQGLTTVAWIRNWTHRWLSHPWFDLFDVVLTSSHFSAELVRAGSRHDPVVFPLATNPRRFHPRDSPRAGVVLPVNNWGQDRGVPELVNAVPSLAVYGKGWDAVPDVAPAWRGHMAYEELPELYAGSAVVVDQTAEHIRPYGAVNSRVFDALAAGALVVTDNVAGAHELFGAQLPVYDSPQHLADIVNAAVDDPGAYSEQIARLRQRVLDHHTYAHRARQLRDRLLARIDAPSFVLRTSVPDRDVAKRWGDWHVAEALARELRAAGHRVHVQTAAEWDERDGFAYDVAVHLKGRSRAPQAPGQVNVIWNISHPEELTPEECDAADLVLVAAPRFAEELQRRTSTPVRVLLQATDHRRFRPLPADPRYRHDVAFVGNSRFVFRSVVRDALEAGLQPAIYGANWERFVPPRLVRAAFIPNEDLPRVYSSVTVLLNDHWEGMRRWGFVSNRIFDALASGSIVVSDDLAELAELFDGAVATYRDSDDLRRTVERLLGDRDEREQRKAAGRAAVLKAHTFEIRAGELLQHVRPLLLRRRMEQA